ncbi:hypothetical protein KUTeg_001087 [Tegillarca granosa]|uniref:Impact N-terminal domain-containing protein n=1 Tax=Tegillarca granosa TaxID=220873 RepID=A0ABQ9FXA4_TEGGR|nr:hypothetical protein KUTeg_001087 [Tegillarca granosa]
MSNDMADNKVTPVDKLSSDTYLEMTTSLPVDKINEEILLKQRVKNSSTEITNQAARGMRYNLIFTSIQESYGENLSDKINNVIVNELKIDPSKPQRQAHAVQITTIRKAGEATIQVLQNPDVAKAYHNVLSCVYLNHKGELKESVNDDQEFGASRKFLTLMHDRKVTNMLLIISRWNPFAQKLGPKLFDHFQTCALDVMKKKTFS